jgi:hypothetical protein
MGILKELSLEAKLIASIRQVARAQNRVADELRFMNERAFPPEGKKEGRTKRAVVISGAPKREDGEE